MCCGDGGVVDAELTRCLLSSSIVASFDMVIACCSVNMYATAYQFQCQYAMNAHHTYLLSLLYIQCIAMMSDSAL